MVFTCYLCNEETVYTKYYCATCEKTKRIVNVYGKEKVLEILEKVCLRKSEKLQNYKINDIKKDLDKQSNTAQVHKKEKEVGDETYLPSPSNNPNEALIDELKNKAYALRSNDKKK